jgi:hypothetical protein
MRGFSTAAIVALLTGAANAQQTLRCDITVKNQCDPSGSCQQIAANIWNEIDLSSQVVKRCDAKGCDSYQALLSPSGAYTNIIVPGRSILAKLGENGAFLEVVTLAESVLVSFGKCQ